MADCRHSEDLLTAVLTAYSAPEAKIKGRKKQSEKPAALPRQSQIPDRSRVILRVIDRLKAV